MTDKRYYVNCAGYLCNMDLNNTLSIFECADKLNKLTEENEQLKQELFESEKEWYECNYADNPARRDDKIEVLKEEFKKRFGRDFE